MWWDETIARWHGEGLPADTTSIFDIHEYFGMDPYIQYWFSTTDPTIEATQHHVEGIVSSMDDYLRLRPQFFPDHSVAIRSMSPWFTRQRAGEAVLWITLEGYFWFPRTLMGFEKLMQVHDRTGLIILSLSMTVLGPMYGAADIMVYKSADPKDVGSITSTNSCIRNGYNATLGFVAGWVIFFFGHNFRIGFVIGIVMSTVGLVMFMIHRRVMRRSVGKD